jgi:ectoine hydroxylase-related dioxygenase (phytanoyl-CoA dioxygenase family)
VLQACDEVGWLRPGVEIGAFDDPAWIRFQGLLQASSEFQALGARPELLEVARRLGGGKAARTLANTCRVASPASPFLITPPHQDAHYVARLERFWTAWIPLHDCPLAQGPIALLPGSHLEGLREHRGERVGGKSADVPSDRVWEAGDLAAGDVLFFDRLTLHRACPSRLPGRLRFSADYRFALGVDEAH